MIKGFDDSFSQQVITRYSYKYDEIDWEVKFIRAFTTDETGETIVNLDKISATESLSKN
jgi:inward rectifier potassium channel